MQIARARRAPALPYAIAFLGGITAAGTPLPLATFASIALALLCLFHAWAARPLLPRVALPIVVATLGFVHMRAALAVSECPVAWLPRGGAARQLELLGTVASAPERAANGERTLIVRARPAHEPQGPLAGVQLRVAPSPAGPAARLDALRSGDVVTVFASLHAGRGSAADEASGVVALAARGFAAAGSVKSARLVERVARAPVLRSLVSVAKAAARRRLDAALGASGAPRAIVGAMLLGDRLLVDPADERLLRRSGLVHLLSVSGLHIALALSAVALLIRRTGMGLAPRVALTLPLIAALTAFVGSDSPVERAALAGGILLIGRALGREGSPLNTLAIAAIVLAATEPAVTTLPSFRLTFAATAGLLLFARPIARALPAWSPVALSLGVSAAAYAASAPIAMLVFGSASPSAVVSNLAGAFLCAWLMVAGAGVIAFGATPWIGSAFAWAARFGVEALLRVAHVCAGLPLGFLRVATPAPGLLALYALLLWSASRPASVRFPRTARRLACTALVVLLAALHLGPPPARVERGMAVDVLDVGQGQAVLVRGGGAVVLVDAGGTSGGRFDAGDRIVARELADRGERRIDVLIVTHLHDDHAGGAAAILRDFEVGELWLPPGFADEPLGRLLAALARERGGALVRGEDGLDFARDGLALRLFHPRPGEFERSDNDRSLVVRAARNGAALVVPGDVSVLGEAVLVQRHAAALTADVLVLPHHGSRSSSSAAFLDAVSPRFAVASAGRFNRFGHPNDDVLRRVAALGAATFRTDRDGTVRFRLEDGQRSGSPAIR